MWNKRRWNSWRLTISLLPFYSEKKSFSLVQEMLFSLSSSTHWFIPHRLCAVRCVPYGNIRWPIVTPTWDYLSENVHILRFEIKSKRKMVVQHVHTKTTKSYEWRGGNQRMSAIYNVFFMVYHVNLAKVWIVKTALRFSFFICLFAHQLAQSALQKLCVSKTTPSE